MRYVPSLPRPLELSEGRTSRLLTQMHSVKPAQPHGMIPPTTRHPETRERPVAEEVALPPRREKRDAQSGVDERRTLCRRIRRQPVLIELRADRDRRKNRQRETDRLEHISQHA